jgi:hypothetical protein
MAMYLAIAGAVIALVRFRSKESVLIGLMLVPLLAFATVLTLEGQYRRFLGTLPFIVMFAGIALGTLWDYASRINRYWAAAAAVIITVCLGYIGQQTLWFYFGGDFQNSEQTRFVYAPEARAALEYIDTLDDPYVYFFDNRRSINYETRFVLAPDIAGGEDRSKEFTTEERAVPRIDLKLSERTAQPITKPVRGAVFVFVNTYTTIPQVAEVAERYPGGVFVERYNEHWERYDFRAYYLPPDLLYKYATAESVTYKVAEQP